jgi:hypothetical protein
VKDWVIPVTQPITLAANGGSQNMQIFASTVGSDAALATGTIDVSTIVPELPTGTVLVVTAVTQGTDPGTTPTTEPSKYFDMALALAYMCKLDIGLSCFMSMVKISYIDQQPNPQDKCWIRLKTAAEEKSAMTSIETGDRNKYYWGALWLMECMNAMVIVHSEPVNVIVEVLAAWFANRNGSGQYVGNKLSMLRLSGSRIKPLGFPSWLQSDVNENDDEGFDLLDAKNVGYLMTIADNTPQDSALSVARGVTGMPINALMISKFIDYSCRQETAKFITDKGTLTDPVLTDGQAYKKIQDIVESYLVMFVPTKRINSIKLTFPVFSTAKTGLTKLEAAHAWSAKYTDDLDEVTVTGGITAE